MTYQFKRIAGVGTLLLASVAAQGSEDPAERSGRAALAIDVDQEDSRHVDGALGYDFSRGWGELRVGRLTAEADEDSFNATSGALAAGYRFEVIDMSASYAYREDSDSLEQHDFQGALTYRFAAGSIGLDVLLRSAQYETAASIERRRRDPLAIRLTESVEGRGVGLHGDVYASTALTLFASAMAYDYDEPADLPAWLTRRERVVVSGITRDNVWLQDTINAGASYQFAVLTLTADVTRDTVLYTDERILTSSLLASIPLAERWYVSPWIGYSDAELSGGTAFGGVEVSVSW